MVAPITKNRNKLKVVDAKSKLHAYQNKGIYLELENNGTPCFLPLLLPVGLLLLVPVPPTPPGFGPLPVCGGGGGRGVPLPHCTALEAFTEGAGEPRFAGTITRALSGDADEAFIPIAAAQDESPGDADTTPLPDRSLC